LYFRTLTQNLVTLTLTMQLVVLGRIPLSQMNERCQNGDANRVSLCDKVMGVIIPPPRPSFFRLITLYIYYRSKVWGHLEKEKKCRNVLIFQRIAQVFSMKITLN